MTIRKSLIHHWVTGLIVAMLFVSFSMTGCGLSNAEKGALGGSAAGALAGQVIGKNTTGTLIGTGIGLGLGYIVGNEMDKKNKAAQSGQ